jgi:hypothetical protein
MTRSIVVALIAGVLASYVGGVPALAKECRMEQQCHWKNFKKYCVWVRVCH